MMKKLSCAMLIAVLLLAVCPPVMAAGLPGMHFWNSPDAELSMQSGGKELVYTQNGKAAVIGKAEYSLINFFVSGSTAVYYAQNAKGKYKWYTYDMDSGVKKEYAYNYLSPFWADDKGVYTTTGGKRVYDYNVYLFNPQTGKKTKLASVYGMPVGYIDGRLVAMDFYHKEIRFYSGSKIEKRVKAAATTGFVVGGTLYTVSSDGVYRLDGSALTRVIDFYTCPQAFINGNAFVYSSVGFPDFYPTEVFLFAQNGVTRLGSADNAEALSGLQKQAVELSRTK